MTKAWKVQGLVLPVHTLEKVKRPLKIPNPLLDKRYEKLFFIRKWLVLPLCLSEAGLFRKNTLKPQSISQTRFVLKLREFTNQSLRDATPRFPQDKSGTLRLTSTGLSAGCNTKKS